MLRATLLVCVFLLGSLFAIAFHPAEGSKQSPKTQLTFISTDGIKPVKSSGDQHDQSIVKIKEDKTLVDQDGHVEAEGVDKSNKTVTTSGDSTDSISTDKAKPRESNTVSDSGEPNTSGLSKNISDNGDSNSTEPEKIPERKTPETKQVNGKQKTSKDDSKEAKENTNESKEASELKESNNSKNTKVSKEPKRSVEVKKDKPKFSPKMLALRAKLRKTLALYKSRQSNTLNTDDYSPWQVMHSIVAFGCNTDMRRSYDGKKVNAIGWLCWNGECEGDSLLMINDGKLGVRIGPGLQGHDGQLLAVLAQSRVKIDYPVRAYGRKFTIGDLVKYEQLDCEAGTELTFKLIGLSNYLKSDAEWKSSDGEKWTIERLVREEIEQPIQGETCGGSHRLSGLSFAVKKRVKRGEPITGQFLRAQKYLNAYHRYTFALQNPDGSFSTEWFRGRGDQRDTDRRMLTTGHTLEWLAFSLSDKELQGERMVKAVDYLSELLLRRKDRSWKIGPLGHALHGLVIYHDRVFKNTKVSSSEKLAPKKIDQKVKRLGQTDPKISTR